MIRIVSSSNRKAVAALLSALRVRDRVTGRAAAAIVEGVRAGGDRALRACARRFDGLSGALGASAGETVRVTPWYAGPLAIPRRHVAYVTPHPAVTNAIETRWAPTGLPVHSAPALSDGALWLGSARRPEPLPDRLRLDFEALWLQSGSGVTVTLFEPEHRMNHLSVTIGPGGVTFVKTLGGTSQMVDRPPGQDMVDLLPGA